VNYIQGTAREQVLLFPEAIDEFIAQENPVRFIDEFVNSLELAEMGFTSTVLSSTGRPPYNPSDLLKLYLYGYLHKTRSNRKLEEETHRNLEVLWLLKKLTPDHKTIANFRRNNTSSLKSVCREFTALCHKEDLFGGDLIAIDGSKFRAANSKDRNFSREKLRKYIQRIDDKVDAYLKQLDEEDEKEKDIKTPTAEELKQKIETIKKRKRLYQSYQRTLEKENLPQMSLTDPDSRSMPTGGVGTDVCFNVQTAVDSKHHLIVHHDVVNEVTDVNQLAKMAIEAKAALGVQTLKVVADRGYYDGGEVKTCEDNHIHVYMNKPETSANKKRGLFEKNDFRYDPRKDAYRCPAGETLKYRSTCNEGGRLTRYYVTSTCRRCRLRPQCTRGMDRRITRWEHESVLDRMKIRIRKHPEVLELRKQIVEHPFGTLKRWMDHGYFLMRGLRNVRAEFSLSVLAYNMKRAIKVLGTQKMIRALA